MLEAARGGLTDDQGQALALLAQACALGSLTEQMVRGLIEFLRGTTTAGLQVAWSTSELREAFHRLYGQPDTIGITLKMSQGGRQPIRGVEGQSRIFEEEIRRRPGKA